MVWPCKQNALGKVTQTSFTLAKTNREDQLNDLEPDGPITLRILHGIAWDFTPAKSWMRWKTVKCGSLISSCCPHNPHEKVGNEERRRISKMLAVWRNAK